MHRLKKPLKNLIILTFIGSLFFTIWYPFTSNLIEDALVRGSVMNSTETKALSPIELEIQGAETIGSINIRSPQQLDSSGSFVTTDRRIIAMRQFLISHHSPLYPYADVFVVEADKYGLDWRLVASISGVESAFGNLIPYGSNNAWGWKGDPNRPWSYFPTWNVGIATVTERLAKGYGTDLTPFDIEATYCPPCGLNPAHAWANGVTNFMNQLEQYEESL